MFNSTLKTKDPFIAKKPTLEAPILEELTPEYPEEDCALPKDLVEEIFQDFDGQTIGPRVKRSMDLLQSTSADVCFPFHLHLVLRQLATFANIGTGHVACNKGLLCWRITNLVAALTVHGYELRSLGEATSAIITALEELVMCSGYFLLEDTSMKFNCRCNMRRQFWSLTPGSDLHMGSLLRRKRRLTKSVSADLLCYWALRMLYITTLTSRSRRTALISTMTVLTLRVTCASVGTSMFYLSELSTMVMVVVSKVRPWIPLA